MKLTEELFEKESTKLLATFNRRPSEPQLKSVFRTLKFHEIEETIYEQVVVQIAMDYAQMPTWGTIKRESEQWFPKAQGCYKCEKGVIRKFRVNSVWHEANSISKAKEIADGNDIEIIADYLCDCELGRFFQTKGYEAKHIPGRS